MQQAMAFMQGVMSCRIKMHRDPSGVSFKIMPGEGMSMEQLKERFGEMINMASSGVPMTVYCGGKPVLSGSMGHSASNWSDNAGPRNQEIEEYIYYI